MKDAFVGIDVAFAKQKRLPVVVCTRGKDRRLAPLALRAAAVKPPAGEGNSRILNLECVTEFAIRTVEYLHAVESQYSVRIRRVAIDAPSDPRPAGAARRRAEAALDQRRISCITTPDSAQFESVCQRGRAHLAEGRPEAELPGANQLWMLVGFSIFRALRSHWDSIEVFPQAIAKVLGAADVHKSSDDGVEAQLRAASRHTGWPVRTTDDGSNPLARHLKAIGFGSRHDLLDAYLAAWVASLEEVDREPFGQPPHDVIWVPRVG